MYSAPPMEGRGKRQSSAGTGHRSADVCIARGALLAFLVCAATLASMVSGASASALNLTGTWSANYHCQVKCAGNNYPATDKLTQAEGSNVVTGTNGSESISGTLTGNAFHYHSKVGSYSAEGTLTVSANGLSWSGPVHDSNGTSGTYTATRVSGPTGPLKTPKAPNKPKTTLLPSSMQVNCNLESPDTPSAFFECTAEVANASLTEPFPVPTGPVSFAVDPGGSGGFRGANLCILKTSELGGNSSFCAVIYWPPPGGVPIGSQPPITATYPGSSVFASSTARPRSALPQIPQASAQPAGSSVPLAMTCPGQTVCKGEVQMTASGAQAAAHGAAAAGTVLVASGRYSIAARAKAKVKLGLTSRGKALLKKHKHRLVLTLKIQPKAGAPVSKAIVLK